MNAAEFIVQMLEEEGVEYLFGVPGGAIEDLNIAVHNSQKIKPIITKHEAGAAYIADGYARVSGRLGVCCSTAGPGATNLITGLATSFADYVPVCALTGQVATSVFGKGAIQESGAEGINMATMFRHFTKYSGMLLNEHRTQYMVQKALRMAHASPGGPVHLNLPADVMKRTTSQEIQNSRRWETRAYDPEAENLPPGYCSMPSGRLLLRGGEWYCHGAPASYWNWPNSWIFRWRPLPKPRGFFPNRTPSLWEGSGLPAPALQKSISSKGRLMCCWPWEPVSMR